MTDLVTLTIPGTPVAKGRGRSTRSGIVYTPTKTRRYEDLGKLAAAEAWGGRPLHLGPVAVEVIATVIPPASWSAKRRREALTGAIRPTGRPDGDNYLKTAQDVLNEIILADDAQIVTATISKVYGIVPEMMISVRMVGAQPSAKRKS